MPRKKNQQLVQQEPAKLMDKNPDERDYLSLLAAVLESNPKENSVILIETLLQVLWYLYLPNSLAGDESDSILQMLLNFVNVVLIGSSTHQLSKLINYLLKQLDRVPAEKFELYRLPKEQLLDMVNKNEKKVRNLVLLGRIPAMKFAFLGVYDYDLNSSIINKHILGYYSKNMVIFSLLLSILKGHEDEIPKSISNFLFNPERFLYDLYRSWTRKESHPIRLIAPLYDVHQPDQVICEPVKIKNANCLHLEKRWENEAIQLDEGDVPAYLASDFFFAFASRLNKIPGVWVTHAHFHANNHAELHMITLPSLDTQSMEQFWVDIYKIYEHLVNNSGLQNSAETIINPEQTSPAEIVKKERYHRRNLQRITEVVESPSTSVTPLDNTPVQNITPAKKINPAVFFQKHKKIVHHEDGDKRFNNTSPPVPTPMEAKPTVKALRPVQHKPQNQTKTSSSNAPNSRTKLSDDIRYLEFEEDAQAIHQTQKLRKSDIKTNSACRMGIEFFQRDPTTDLNKSTRTFQRHNQAMVEKIALNTAERDKIVNYIQQHRVISELFTFMNSRAYTSYLGGDTVQIMLCDKNMTDPRRYVFHVTGDRTAIYQQLANNLSDYSFEESKYRSELITAKHKPSKKWINIICHPENLLDIEYANQFISNLDLSCSGLLVNPRAELFSLAGRDAVLFAKNGQISHPPFKSWQETLFDCQDSQKSYGDRAMRCLNFCLLGFSIVEDDEFKKLACRAFLDLDKESQLYALDRLLITAQKLELRGYLYQLLGSYGFLSPAQVQSLSSKLYIHSEYLQQEIQEHYENIEFPRLASKNCN